MSKKPNRRNTIYFSQHSSYKYNELPSGYFYKDKFYTENACFNALLKDGEVATHSFPRGGWSWYNNIIYPSLRLLYEDFEDEIEINYNKFKRCYKSLGIEHVPTESTLYTYDRDDYNILYHSKTEVLEEIKFNTNLIEDADDREGMYIEDMSEEECRVYLKKPIKERIKLLEDYYLPKRKEII